MAGRLVRRRDPDQVYPPGVLSSNQREYCEAARERFQRVIRQTLADNLAPIESTRSCMSDIRRFLNEFSAASGSRVDFRGDFELLSLRERVRHED